MDLFALGTPVVDLFARVDGKAISGLGLTKGATNYFPAKKLAAIERSLGKKIAYRYAGDNARNVCEGFAALGGFAGYQGSVGDDEDGAYFLANLQECGIAPFLQERKGSTGKILALVTPDSERTFCADLGVSPDCSRWEKIPLSETRMFFATSITLAGNSPIASLALRYLEACRKMGKKIALALESPPMVASHRKFLLRISKKYAGVLFMNENEAEALLGRGYEKKLLSFKPQIPIYLKKGKAGSVLYLHRQAHTISSIKGKVVDTTGAGDAYAAGVLYGLSRHYSPLGCGRLGCMLATSVVGKIGAGIPLAHTRINYRRNLSEAEYRNSAKRIRIKHAKK
jgi:sugar/nucleoside kinase (ribokinase family)